MWKEPIQLCDHLVYFLAYGQLLLHLYIGVGISEILESQMECHPNGNWNLEKLNNLNLKNPRWQLHVWKASLAWNKHPNNSRNQQIWTVSENTILQTQPKMNNI